MDRTSPPPSATRQPTILLVEDDQLVATTTSAWLKKLGYDVILCLNGRDASSFASGRKEPIDLLLADVMLPGLPGPALAASMRSRHPEMAVLFSSGYSPELLGEMFSPHMDSAPLLYKPYNADQLAKRVAQALDRSSRSGAHPVAKSAPKERFQAVTRSNA